MTSKFFKTLIVYWAQAVELSSLKTLSDAQSSPYHLPMLLKQMGGITENVH
jgi:hypothetical protein